jgi:hypothetical protein
MMNEIEYIEKIDFDQIIQIIHNFHACCISL